MAQELVQRRAAEKEKLAEELKKQEIEARAKVAAAKAEFEAANARAEAARREERRCKEFIGAGADQILRAVLGSANQEETWDKRYAKKCVRWSVKFKQPGFAAGFYGTVGKAVDLDCDLLNPGELDGLRSLDKWAVITVEGRLDNISKAAGTLRGTVELADCVITKR